MKITQPNLLYGWSLAFRRLHICRWQQWQQIQGNQIKYQLKELFFLYWFWLPLQLKPKPCKKVTTIPNHLRPSSPQLGLLTTLQVTLLTQRKSNLINCVNGCFCYLSMSEKGVTSNNNWSTENCWSTETSHYICTF